MSKKFERWEFLNKWLEDVEANDFSEMTPEQMLTSLIQSFPNKHSGVAEVHEFMQHLKDLGFKCIPEVALPNANNDFVDEEYCNYICGIE